MRVLRILLSLILFAVVVSACSSSDDDTHQVVFKAGAQGTGSDVSTYVEEDKDLILPGSPATWTIASGYELTGWLLDGTTTVYAVGASFEVKESATFVAQYGTTTPPVTYYKVTYAPGAAGGSSVSVEAKEGTYTLLPTMFTYAGNVFSGWNAGAAGSTVTLTGDTTFTAQWTAVTPDPEYTLAFSSAGGTAVADVETVDGFATIPADPTYTGYTFDGWTIPSAPGAKYFAGSKVKLDADDTATANWIPGGGTPGTTKTITMNIEGEEVQLVVGDNATITMPSSPIANGTLTFDGWATTDGGPVVYAPGQTVNVTDDMDLYAVWSGYKVTIKLEYGGPGGHSNGAYGNTNAVHAAARALEKLYTDATITQGIPFVLSDFFGGNSVNAIPTDGHFTVTAEGTVAEMEAFITAAEAAIAGGLEDENAFRPRSVPIRIVDKEITKVGF